MARKFWDGLPRLALIMHSSWLIVPSIPGAVLSSQPLLGMKPDLISLSSLCAFSRGTAHLPLSSPGRKAEYTDRGVPFRALPVLIDLEEFNAIYPVAKRGSVVCSGVCFDISASLFWTNHLRHVRRGN